MNKQLKKYIRQILIENDSQDTSHRFGHLDKTHWLNFETNAINQLPAYLEILETNALETMLMFPRRSPESTQALFDTRVIDLDKRIQHGSNIPDIYSGLPAKFPGNYNEQHDQYVRLKQWIRKHQLWKASKRRLQDYYIFIKFLLENDPPRATSFQETDQQKTINKLKKLSGLGNFLWKTNKWKEIPESFSKEKFEHAIELAYALQLI